MADVKIISKALEQLSARAKSNNVQTFGTEKIYSLCIKEIKVVEYGEIGLSLHKKNGAEKPTCFKLLFPNYSTLFASAANNIDLSSVKEGDSFTIYENISPKMVKKVDADGNEVMKDGYYVYEQIKDDKGFIVNNMTLRVVAFGTEYSPSLFSKK